MGMYTLFKNIKFLMKNKLYKQNNDDLEIFLQMFSQKHDLFLIFPYSIGETTCIASCLMEWKKIHNKDITVFVKSELMERLLQIYKELNVIKVSTDVFNKLILKKIDCINYLDNIYDGDFKEKNMYSLIKKSMNLPLSFPYNKCCLEDRYIQNANKILDNLELDPNKTILCIPFANCLGNTVVSKKFWKQFCEEAFRKGYNVIFNSDTPIVPEVPYCFLSFSDVLALSSICNKIISVRTGLIDFIAANSLNNNIYVIYPDDTNEIWDNHPQIFVNLKKCFIIDDTKSLVDNYIESASLKMFNSNVIEYKNDSEDKIIEDILN